MSSHALVYLLVTSQKTAGGIEILLPTSDIYRDQLNSFASNSLGCLETIALATVTSTMTFCKGHLLLHSSIWSSIEEIQNYHNLVINNFSNQWKEQNFGELSAILWWIPKKHRPSLLEIKDRLQYFLHYQDTAFSFSLQKIFSLQDSLSFLPSRLLPQLEEIRFSEPACTSLQPTKIVHQNRWFSVYQRGDFLTIEPTTKSAVILPIVDHHSIVLVQVKRPILNDISWEIPSGGLEQDETPAEGAARELCEETGISIAPQRLQPLPPIAAFPRNPHLTYVFQAHLTLVEFEQRKPHDNEINQVALLPFATVQEYLVSGKIYLSGFVAILSRFLLQNKR